MVDYKQHIRPYEGISAREVKSLGDALMTNPRYFKKSVRAVLDGKADEIIEYLEGMSPSQRKIYGELLAIQPGSASYVHQMAINKGLDYALTAVKNVSQTVKINLGTHDPSNRRNLDKILGRGKPEIVFGNLSNGSGPGIRTSRTNTSRYNGTTSSRTRIR